MWDSWEQIKVMQSHTRQSNMVQEKEEWFVEGGRMDCTTLDGGGLEGRRRGEKNRGRETKKRREEEKISITTREKRERKEMLG